ncbi:MAG TPA: hemerythrin domain-containing protein [Polyangia bacterium]|jgi:hypothetical protein|nr:hemerythrin domain-containing protein [Polyangia bacterium]
MSAVSDSYNRAYRMPGRLSFERMDAMRTDLYGLVHKAQRHRLFTLGNELGTADIDDPAIRTHFASAVRGIADMLADHAENERRYIHPLFAVIGGAAERIEHEHHEIEALLDGWVEIVDQKRWAELYGATMRIIGQYLLHIDAEERAQTEVLWPNYTDAELGAVLARFKAERDPAAARADLALLIPVLSAPQRAALGLDL